MITIYNWSKGQEDIFLISLGEKVKTNILIDGGKSGKKCIEKIDEINIDTLDYIVLTHIDQDHIKGLIKMLKNREDCKDTVVVYNKFINGVISYKQAEAFEKLIQGYEVIVSYKEYQDNSGDLIFLSVSQRKKLKRDKEKIYITFLAPAKNKVQKLYEYYNYYKTEDKLKENNSEIVNRSSIMFILEYRDLAILMTGDGYIEDIMPAIECLSSNKQTNEPIKKFDLIKIPHHGSEKNNEKMRELLKIIECDDFIITNKFTDFKHGDVKIKKGLIEVLQGKRIYSSSYNGDYKDTDNKETVLQIEKKSSAVFDERSKRWI